MEGTFYLNSHSLGFRVQANKLKPGFKDSKVLPCTKHDQKYHRKGLYEWSLYWISVQSTLKDCLTALIL